MDEKKVLIIDDDHAVCDLLVDIAESCHYQVCSTTEAGEFHDLYRNNQPDLIFLDLYLGSTDGVRLLRLLADEKSKSKIILISGYGERILSTSALLGKSHGLEILCFLQKPVKVNEIKKILNELNDDGDCITAEKVLKGIKDNEFILYFQPKVSINEGKTVGMESLLRWNKAGSCMIMPDKIFPVIENSDVMHTMTNWVVEQAFACCSKLSNGNSNVELSINLSRKDLDDLTLPDRMSDLAVKHQVNPESICFEITETAVMGQPQIVMEILIRLRLAGFKLSIDDFGTGYSSLVELRKMPVTEVKIDKSFILDLINDNDDQVITRAIIDLGHNLGLQVTAEGVESFEILNLLKKYNCDIAQGFYLSRPLPFDQLCGWLNMNNAENGERRRVS